MHQPRMAARLYSSSVRGEPLRISTVSTTEMPRLSLPAHAHAKGQLRSAQLRPPRLRPSVEGSPPGVLCSRFCTATRVSRRRRRGQREGQGRTWVNQAMASLGMFSTLSVSTSSSRSEGHTLRNLERLAAEIDILATRRLTLKRERRRSGASWLFQCLSPLGATSSQSLHSSCVAPLSNQISGSARVSSSPSSPRS